MKRTIALAVLAAAIAGPVMAADVGLSINVAQPGFFGQLDIGAAPPPPALIYARPVVVVRERGYVGGPIYLHVPPGYERHWARHCVEYGACGRPVYFVRDDWYRREYVPHQERYRHDGERREARGYGHRDEQGRDHDHDRR